MKSLAIALTLVLASFNAKADATAEAKALAQVKFQLDDHSTALGRANVEIQKPSDIDGTFKPLQATPADMGKANVITLSQIGSRTDTSSTILVRIPFESGSSLMWERRSISVIVHVNSSYEDSTDLTSYQVLVDQNSVRVNQEH